MVDYKKLKPGDKLIWKFNDFDGAMETECTVTEIYKDHALAVDETTTILWIDEDTASDFFIKNLTRTLRLL